MPDHAARMRALEGKIGWRLTELRKPSGAAMLVSTGMLIDAWLRVLAAPGADDPESEERALLLPQQVSQFLAYCKPDGSALLTTLCDVSRRVWSLNQRSESVPAGSNPQQAKGAP